MKVPAATASAGLPLWVFLAILLSGCATSRIDWSKRIGVYTYDQTVLELGPPDKQAKLNDGTTIADWLVNRGFYYSSPTYYGYAPFGVYYPAYTDTYRTPDAFLRLTFGSDGKLRGWKRYNR